MGFYSQVEPKLVTYMRGADEGIDTQWMSSAASVGYVMGWINRSASFIGEAFGVGARSAMYKTVGSFLARTAGKIFAASPGGWAGFLARRALSAASGLIVLDLIWQAAEFAYEGGQEKQKDYVGLVQGAMDANPIMFLPLSYEGRPHVAGLTGSTGPASLTEVAADAVDKDGLLSEDSTADIIDRIASLYDAGQQAPTQQ